MEGKGTVAETVPLHLIIGYNLIYLGVNYLWISFETIILPLQVGGAVSISEAGLILGIAASVGNGFGIIGNLSAGLTAGPTRTGRKRGTRYVLSAIIAVFLTMLMENSFGDSVFLIVLGYSVLQASTNLLIGTIQPVIAELQSADQRGTSAGINGLFSLTGAALGFSVTALLVSRSMENIALYAIAVTVLLTGSISMASMIRVRKASFSGTNQASPTDEGVNDRIFSRFTLGSFFMFSGITGLTYFELYFIKESLNIASPVIYVGIAGIVVLTVSAASSVVVGHFSSRIGRWNIMAADGIIAAIPTVMIPFFHSFYIFLVFGAFIGAAYGSFYSVSFATAGDLIPGRLSGRYMSFFYLSISMASTVTPIIYGLALFGFSFTALFMISSIFYVAGSALIFFTGRMSGSH